MADHKNKLQTQAFCVNTFRRSLEGKTPCYGCEERHYRCHSECDRYNKWRIDHNERKNEIAKENKNNNEAFFRKREAVEKYYRHEGKWRT